MKTAAAKTKIPIMIPATAPAVIAFVY